jgi:hypothetical protein
MMCLTHTPTALTTLTTTNTTTPPHSPPQVPLTEAEKAERAAAAASKPNKLALGTEGGFALESQKDYTLDKSATLVVIQGLGQPRLQVPLPCPDLPELVLNVITAIQVGTHIVFGTHTAFLGHTMFLGDAWLIFFTTNQANPLTVSSSGKCSR